MADFTTVSRRRLMAVAVALGVVGAGLAGSAAAAARPFIAGFAHTSLIASAMPSSGPAKGDVNPYGVAVVPSTRGTLTRGDVLVANFNDAANAQGTGSSIMEIAPSGARRVFAVVRPHGAPVTGLTTALVALRNGDVIVGNLPAPGGKASRMTAGALTVLNATGHVIGRIAGSAVNGPWDMTAVDHGRSATLFVTNVLNGTVAARGHVVSGGTVVRIGLSFDATGGVSVRSHAVIASGFAEHTDPNALVVGPTGVGLGRGGVLYVADSNGNRIAAVPGALTRTTPVTGGGRTVSAGHALNDPLGLLIAPNGDVVTANGGNGRIVETSPAGRQVATRTLMANGAGDLFGLALAPHGMYFVNDAGSGPLANSLDVLH